MSQELERKLQIYKLRVANLIEEHADALAQAQMFHQNLQDADKKISHLERLLKEKNVQKEESNHAIINHSVDSPKI